MSADVVRQPHIAAPPRPGAGRRGVSLVEVLVVLVILIVGIFAISRLFPEGFANLDYTGTRTQALGEARRQEEYLHKNRDSLPDGIVAVDPATGLVRTNLSPGELHSFVAYTDNPINGAAGQAVGDPRYSGINVARRIIGEQFRIPPPTPAYGPNAETVSLYRPLFGPIYSPAALGGASLGISAYSGTPMVRVVFQDPPSPENRSELLGLGVHGYGIDYDRALLYLLPAPYDRYFKIEFSYRSGAAGIGQSVPDNCFFVAADPNALPNPDPTGLIKVFTFNLRVPQAVPGCTFIPVPAGTVVDPGSDTVRRRFNQIAAAVAFSGDPYEFKVYDTIFGLLGFNPITASLPLPFHQGRGLTARIDYDADDWHIVRHDATVPLQQDNTGPSGTGNGMLSVKLTTGAIKQYGETEETLNLLGAGPGAIDGDFAYQGLLRNYPAGAATGRRPGTTGIDLVIVDLQSGYTIDNTTLQKSGNNSNGEIDYATGVVRLRDDPANNRPLWTPPNALGGSAVYIRPHGRNVRIYYRSYNDFGVSTYKPHRSYLLSQVLPVQAQQYYSAYGSGYLLFASAEQGKTVAVDYRWQDTSGRVHTETGELHRIEGPDDPAPPPSSTTPVAGCTGTGAFDPAGYWWVRVVHSNPDGCKTSASIADPNGDVTVVPGSVQVTGVRGVSLHTRVAWRDASRMRIMERSTILTREKTR